MKWCKGVVTHQREAEKYVEAIMLTCVNFSWGRPMEKLSDGENGQNRNGFWGLGRTAKQVSRGICYKPDEFIPLGSIW